MADDVIDRIRAVDPLPHGSTAPSFEHLVAEFAKRSPEEPQARGGRRRAWGASGTLLPGVLTVAVSLGVIAVVVVVALTGTRARTNQPSRDAPHPGTGPARPVPAPTAPRTGMPGFVSVWGASFTTSGTGVISLEQCLGCHANGNIKQSSRVRDWLLSTRDGGRSWRQSTENYYLDDPSTIDRSGWSTGMQVLTKSESDREHLPAEWEPGAGTPLFYESQDSGADWKVAPAPAQPHLESVSLGWGEVWAVAFGTASIVHAPQTSRRLMATSSQPVFSGNDANIGVAGAGTGLAYAVNSGEPGQGYVTHDDGASWSRMTEPPCRGRVHDVDLDAAVGQTVWLTCLSGTFRHLDTHLLRSVDGGASWRDIGEPFGPNGPEQFTAVSASSAWALTGTGDLRRTTDAGTHWTTVWSLADEPQHPLSGPAAEPSLGPGPLLSAQSSTSATIVTLLNRHQARSAAKLTNLVAYRTTDGGRSWRTTVVPLSATASR